MPQSSAPSCTRPAADLRPSSPHGCTGHPLERTRRQRHRHAAADAGGAHHAVDIAGTEVWSTRADPGQFQSAIVNMAVNARDAMAQGRQAGGRNPQHGLRRTSTSISIPSCSPENTYSCRSRTPVPACAPEVRDRVFEPFFTTKEKGQGTGLGLAMVYGFVKQAGGHVTIYSEVGLGTTINLYLPRTQINSPDEKQAAEAARSPASNETVLVK